MKTLEKFLSENPSYVKCGDFRIATQTNISLNTVARFKRSTVFKNLKNSYLNKG